MSQAITRPERIFKMGSVTLSDVAPDEKPEKILELYSMQYPHLSTATLSNPVTSHDGTQIEYTIIKPEVTTKG